MDWGSTIISFLLNDWPIRRFLVVSFSLQWAFVGTLALESIGIEVDVGRSLIGFLIIVLVPGFSLLRIMKIHNIEAGKTILLSVALSLSFVMAVGVFVTVTSSLTRFPHPMTGTPFLTGLIAGLIALSALAFVRDRGFEPSLKTHPSSTRGRVSSLIPLVILMLAVTGVSIVNATGQNLLIMIFILSISMFPLIAASWRQSKNLSSVTIFLLSLALTWHVTLFTSYVSGTDVFGEYYFANSTVLDGYWNYSSNHPLSGTVSVTVLPSAFHLVCNIDVNTYIKVISPIFFSLVPVALMYAYRRVFGDSMTRRELFFAAFFVISMWQFYGLMTGVVRQQLGEFFLILLLVVLMDRWTNRPLNPLLTIILSASLVISHYTIAYFFLFFLLIAIAVNRYLDRTNRDQGRKIGFNYLATFAIILFSWNMFIGHGSVLHTVSIMATNVTSGFSSLFDPGTNAVVRMVTTSSAGFVHDIFRLVNYAVVFFLLVGGTRIIREIRDGTKGHILFYYGVSISNYILILSCFLVPYLGYQLGFDRVLQSSTLILAPFLIFGVKDVNRWLSRTIRKYGPAAKEGNRDRKWLPAFFLSIVLLLGSGIVQALTNDPYPSSVPLSDSVRQSQARSGVYAVGQAMLESRIMTAAEVTAAVWLDSHRGNDVRIHAGFGCNELTSYGMLYGSVDMLTTDNLSAMSGYFYYGSLGKTYHIQIIKPSWREAVVIDSSSIENGLSAERFGKIYSSYASDIYLRQHVS